MIITKLLNIIGMAGIAVGLFLFLIGYGAAISPLVTDISAQDAWNLMVSGAVILPSGIFVFLLTNSRKFFGKLKKVKENN